VRDGWVARGPRGGGGGWSERGGGGVQAVKLCPALAFFLAGFRLKHGMSLRSTN
jgi:hypothetical protein